MYHSGTIWGDDNATGRRQYIVSYLRHAEGKPMHLYSLAQCIGEMDGRITKNTFHASTYRRILTADIDAINWDPDSMAIIKSDNSGVRICYKDDAAAMYEAERREAIKKLAKCERIARKAGLNRQLTITGDEIKSIMEVKDAQ